MTKTSKIIDHIYKIKIQVIKFVSCSSVVGKLNGMFCIKFKMLHINVHIYVVIALKEFKWLNIQDIIPNY